jgi:spore germination cell wall hydrolase CwlJ-like protein
MTISPPISKTGTRSTVLKGLLFALLVIATLVIYVNGTKPWAYKDHPKAENKQPKRLLHQSQVPAVEPVALKAVPPADARAFNATVPFSTEPNPPARPFKFVGSDQDRSRALACLAAAVLYEAGDDSTGQQAVAQVVLNRVRHPAFPKTVCGVVFQGSERQTGCQFTFTCDGALHRSYADQTWARAGAVADAALSGSVYKPVGQATHYHTDWVVPYWSSSLDKIVAVGTHLFFRWTGWWGTPPAFRFGATGVEPHIPQLALRFPEHLPGEGSLETEVGTSSLDRAFVSATTQGQSKDGGVFFVHLSSKDAEKFPMIAARACGDRSYCWFVGWTDASKVPRSKSADFMPAQRNAMSFSYLHDSGSNFEKTSWNCRQFKRPAEQCLRGEID